MEQNNEMTLEQFNSMPVSKVVIKNAVPAMLAMLMFLIYNLADTFFISQPHDAYQIAAISLTTPLFMMFSAFGTIFGGGGLSVISRAAGKQEKEYIRRREYGNQCLQSESRQRLALCLWVFLLCLSIP